MKCILSDQVDVPFLISVHTAQPAETEFQNINTQPCFIRVYYFNKLAPFIQINGQRYFRVEIVPACTYPNICLELHIHKSKLQGRNCVD